jgi:hypothetical protein
VGGVLTFGVVYARRPQALADPSHGTRRAAGLLLLLNPDTRPRLDCAARAAARDDFAAALQHSRRELARHPDAPAAAYLRAAHLARRAEELDEAEQLLAVAARRGPGGGRR